MYSRSATAAEKSEFMPGRHNGMLDYKEQIMNESRVKLPFTPLLAALPLFLPAHAATRGGIGAWICLSGGLNRLPRCRAVNP